MTKVKICGLMTTADVNAVNSAQPDYAGFVFARGRHQLDKQKAAKLKRILDNKIQAVGVFMDTPASEIIDLFNAGIISVAQLHGYGNQEMIGQLRTAGIVTIRVFVNEPINANLNANFSMIDSGYGSGNLLNLDNLNVDHTVFLAGGLTPINVSQAINKIHPFAVDVSSGVETDGKKDPEKINEFIKQVKRSDSYARTQTN